MANVRFEPKVPDAAASFNVGSKRQLSLPLDDTPYDLKYTECQLWNEEHPNQRACP